MAVVTALHDAYLTDGKRLVQVLSVGDTDLVCENVKFNCDEPAPTITISRENIGEADDKWRLVVPA